ncbi:SUMF1/EgtB/PvdO family nonheme iron enzyme [Rhodobacteraceae bacterium]|nr:SUMF1/EgtB/PvdO family nonheme iron enzyme [Paracoccaceae bacterium]
MRTFWVLFFSLWFCLGATPSTSESRIALVIGNASYSVAPTLKNPANDANAIAASLERLGFKVFLGLDQDINQFREFIYQFSQQAKEADLALFYYAGHGLQVSGKNYLLPVDADLESETDLDFSAIDLQLVLKHLERNAANSVVLLDACRDNPFETTLKRAMGATRSAASLGRGLAPVETLGGALIGFATDPGEVAFDGEGQHSPFTEALLNHIETPGLEINTLMTRVRADVVNTTNQRQRPWATWSLLNELFMAPVTPITTEPDADPVLEDVAAWRAAEGAVTPTALRDYLAQFPQGLFADQAGRSLAILTAAPAPEEDKLAAVSPPKMRPKDSDTAPSSENSPEISTLPFDAGRFRAIPAGQFRMGSESARAGSEEKPAINVTIKAFSMLQGEVTVSDDRWFLDRSAYTPSQGCYVWTDQSKMRWRDSANWSDPGFAATDDMPVACINWEHAQAYADWLSAEYGLTARLPSEAELEYAIRAGSTNDYPFNGGAEAVCEVVNAAEASSRFRWRNNACDDGFPTVASADGLSPNSFGLVATTGNLWEWAADCWNPSHRGAASDGSARFTGQCAHRTLRGGSWDDPLENLRSSYRVGIPA